VEPTDETPRTGPLELRLRIEAAGPVPVAPVWERYEIPRLWPTWSPQLRSVELANGAERLAAGTTGRVHGPLGIWADFTVLSVDAAARRWSWLVRRGPLAVRLEHAVEARVGEPGSRTTLVLHGPAPVVVGYLPIAWYALHRLVTLPPER
jgi:hypothetical protein